MKNLLIIVIGLALIISCTPDEFPPLGDRPDRVQQLTGAWKVTQVTQTDNDAVRKGFPFFAQQQDITSAFNFTDLEIVLNVDNSFAVDAGTAPNVIGMTAGQWETDDAEYPSEVIFKNGGQQMEIGIGSFASIGEGILTLKVIRYEDKGDALQPVITYEYKLKKQN
ncbi:hypothetical protein C900_01384 [Fulvivirga imtechensis AK7]|uniref:DUF5004 domain-containing protein n=1 Tax=Fulvivirga imtechensis AK7 TaxID=1237149 RepID=L8K1I0_9BACT|nr:DUF5004 domain-containing protein [Fulvivirga imtechensis]ELR73774.1 hypothetical protein C900_01384 [Fulvivirga imtechensis AK7]